MFSEKIAGPWKTQIYGLLGYKIFLGKFVKPSGLPPAYLMYAPLFTSNCHYFQIILRSYCERNTFYSSHYQSYSKIRFLTVVNLYEVETETVSLDVILPSRNHQDVIEISSGQEDANVVTNLGNKSLERFGN